MDYRRQQQWNFPERGYDRDDSVFSLEILGWIWKFLIHNGIGLSRAIIVAATVAMRFERAVRASKTTTVIGRSPHVRTWTAAADVIDDHGTSGRL